MITTIGAGAVYAAVQVFPQVLSWLSKLRLPTPAPPSVQSMRIDKTIFTYDDCLIGGNIETFTISNAPSSNFIFSLQNAQAGFHIESHSPSYINEFNSCVVFFSRNSCVVFLAIFCQGTFISSLEHFTQKGKI